MVSLINGTMSKVLKIMLLCLVCLLLVIVLPFKMEFKADAINFLLYVLSIFAILFAVFDYLKSLTLMKGDKDDR